MCLLVRQNKSLFTIMMLGAILVFFNLCTPITNTRILIPYSTLHKMIHRFPHDFCKYDLGEKQK